MQIKRSTVVEIPGVKEARKQLANLGEQIENARREYNQLIANGKKIEYVSKTLKSLELEIIEKQGFLDKLKTVEEEYNNLVLKINNGLFELKQVERSLFQHRKQFKNESEETLEKRNVALQELQVVNEEVEKLRSVCVELKKESEQMQKEKDVLDEKVKKSLLKAETATSNLRIIEGRLKNAKSLEQKCQIEVTKLKEEKVVLVQSLSVLEKKVEEEKKKIIEIIQKEMGVFEKEMALKKKANDEREGELSIREKWLEEKSAALRSVKEELEKHFNRKFNNIII